MDREKFLEKLFPLIGGKENTSLCEFQDGVLYVTLKDAGLSDENAVEAIFTELWGIRSENAEYNGIADYLEQIVVRPACIRFLGMIIWAVVFALCSLVLHLIVRAVLVVRKLQPIKACDSILGAVAGAAAGAAVIAACCMLIVLAVRWTGGTEYMNEDIFSHTLVFGRIYDLMTELKI